MKAKDLPKFTVRFASPELKSEMETLAASHGHSLTFELNAACRHWLATHRVASRKTSFNYENIERIYKHLHRIRPKR